MVYPVQYIFPWYSHGYGSKGQAFFGVMGHHMGPMGHPFLWRLKHAMKFGTSAVDRSTWRTGLKMLRVKQRQGLWSWDILRMCWWGIPSDTLEDLRGRAPCGQTLLSQPPVAQIWDKICKNLRLLYSTLQAKFSSLFTYSSRGSLDSWPPFV